MEKQIGKSFNVMEQDDAADKLQTLENISAKNLSHIKTLDKKYKTSRFFVQKFEDTFGTAKTVNPSACADTDSWV